jgi:Zn-dependent peptidase ImmA (M78 family)/transcriptional regulator with XRE-family HTH domain
MGLRTVNPEMLVLARESCGMSQAELAEATRIAQSKLSKYENQLIEIDAADLSRIATVLGYSEDFFYQVDRVYGLGSSSLFNRRRQVIPVGLHKQAQARVNVLRMQVARLLKSVEIDTPNAFARMDVQEYDGDVERIAETVRAAWRVPLGPVIDLTAAVENAGGIVSLCDFGTPKIDAAHLWLPDAPPMFFLHKGLAADRYRFTLAHEIGHAVMHRFPIGEIEREADRFAAEFLMPAEEIRPHLTGLTLRTAAALKPHWRVSMAALVRRAFDLQQITDRQYKRLNEQLSALGYRTNEPIPLKSEQPNALRQVVSYHRRSLGYKDVDMEKLLYRSDWDDTFGERTQTPRLRMSSEPMPMYPDERKTM